MGSFKCAYRNDGTSYAQFICNKHDNSTDAPTMGVFCDVDNLGYAQAPSTRSDRSSGTDIVTRDWIPSDTRIVHITGAETITGNKITNAQKTNHLSSKPEDKTIPEI